MKSFKEFLTEIFDNPYPYEKREDLTSTNPDIHFYDVSVPKKRSKVRVGIAHLGSEGRLFFFDTKKSAKSNQWKATNDKKTKATRILSTVAAITKEHASSHPQLQKITFSADKDEESRTSLYNKLVPKMGGTVSSLNYDDKTEYSVPVNQGK